MHKSLIVVLLPLLLVASGQAVAQMGFSSDYVGRQMDPSPILQGFLLVAAIMFPLRSSP